MDISRLRTDGYVLVDVGFARDEGEAQRLIRKGDAFVEDEQMRDQKDRRLYFTGKEYNIKIGEETRVFKTI